MHKKCADKHFKQLLEEFNDGILWFSSEDNFAI